ncbi:hypothetical protein VTK56DRAFT_5239 [Thermocarpiscus australiensis]
MSLHIPKRCRTRHNFRLIRLTLDDDDRKRECVPKAAVCCHSLGSTGRAHWAARSSQLAIGGEWGCHEARGRVRDEGQRRSPAILPRLNNYSTRERARIVASNHITSKQLRPSRHPETPSVDDGQNGEDCDSTTPGTVPDHSCPSKQTTKSLRDRFLRKRCSLRAVGSSQPSVRTSGIFMRWMQRKQRTRSRIFWRALHLRNRARFSPLATSTPRSAFLW